MKGPALRSPTSLKKPLWPISVSTYFDIVTCASTTLGPLLLADGACVGGTGDGACAFLCCFDHDQRQLQVRGPSRRSSARRVASPISTLRHGRDLWRTGLRSISRRIHFCTLWRAASDVEETHGF